MGFNLFNERHKGNFTFLIFLLKKKQLNDWACIRGGERGTRPPPLVFSMSSYSPIGFRHFLWPPSLTTSLLILHTRLSCPCRLSFSPSISLSPSSPILSLSKSLSLFEEAQPCPISGASDSMTDTHQSSSFRGLQSGGP